MNRLEQDAAEVMAWHERQARARRGFGPKPSDSPMRTVRYEITEQERMEREQQIADGILPF